MASHSVADQFIPLLSRASHSVAEQPFNQLQINRNQSNRNQLQIMISIGELQEPTNSNVSEGSIMEINVAHYQQQEWSSIRGALASPTITRSRALRSGGRNCLQHRRPKQTRRTGGRSRQSLQRLGGQRRLLVIHGEGVRRCRSPPRAVAQLGADTGRLCGRRRRSPPRTTARVASRGKWAQAISCVRTEGGKGGGQGGQVQVACVGGGTGGCRS